MPSKLVGVLEFAGPCEIEDVEEFLTRLNDSWQFETELDLSDGHIRIWRVEDEP